MTIPMFTAEEIAKIQADLNAFTEAHDTLLERYDDDEAHGASQADLDAQQDAIFASLFKIEVILKTIMRANLSKKFQWNTAWWDYYTAFCCHGSLAAQYRAEAMQERSERPTVILAA